MNALDLTTLSDVQIANLYKKQLLKENELGDWLCDNGFGHMRPSEMRSIPKNERPAMLERYLESLAFTGQLIDEARRRVGPSMLFVEELIWGR